MRSTLPWALVFLAVQSALAGDGGDFLAERLPPPRPLSRATILVLPAEAPPSPRPAFRVTGFFEGRPATGDETATIGGGAGAGLDLPAGPVNLLVFLEGGSGVRRVSRIEERSWTETVGGEEITFVQRVEIEEDERRDSGTAGAGLSLPLLAGVPWILEAQAALAGVFEEDRFAVAGRAAFEFGWRAPAGSLRLRIGADVLGNGPPALRVFAGVAVTLWL